MRHVAAIGFDLFNTLIEANAGALNEAMDRLIQSLQKKTGWPEIRTRSRFHTNRLLFLILKKPTKAGRRPTTGFGYAMH